MNYDRMLAKSKRGELEVTLLQHTLDVVEAAEALFGNADQTTRLCECWLRFFRLDPQLDRIAFNNNLLAACLFHDWGKANGRMQDVLRNIEAAQVFRHEHLSVLLLGSEGVLPWLHQRSDIAWPIVLAAVGSHHLKFGDEEFARPVDDATLVCFTHPDFQKLLDTISQRLSLASAPIFPKQSYWGFTRDAATFNPLNLRNSMRDNTLRAVTLACRHASDSTLRMLNAVRSALITADAAGSGLRRTGQTVTQWVEQRFEKAEICNGPFVEHIIQERIDDLTRRNKWHSWNEFQTACDQLPSRSLLLAPCGSGKTLAAWRWIAAQVKQRPVQRVLFLYPTRATATEGFKDYVSWAPEADASLMHGTADYDLEGMFTADDRRTNKEFNRTDPRLFAIRHWSKRVFSATVDQFFGFLSYGYGPMCLLPVLADSVIVIDEVHSFDRAMFSALQGFLNAFDVPVLCMTATLQSGRKAQLATLLEVAEDKPGELAKIAGAPRYRIRRGTEAEAEQAARQAIADGKRVLWVVNQVSRAQVFAIKFADLGKRAISYHSRFKLDDRVARHRDTVNAIRSGQPATLGITTQVCEMSLDIDADLLITEECPITSLIQRMGRCRRGRDELAAKGPGEVFVYKPEQEKVYSPDDLAGLEPFLASLSAQAAASQSDAETGLERHGVRAAEAPKLNSFLASGPYALAGVDSFRDIDEFNAQSVLDSEIDDYLAAAKSRQPGFIVPVPKKLKPASDSRLPPYLHVADHLHYDQLTGYWDTPVR